MNDVVISVLAITISTAFYISQPKIESKKGKGQEVSTWLHVGINNFLTSDMFFFCYFYKILIYFILSRAANKTYKICKKFIFWPYHEENLSKQYHIPKRLIMPDNPFTNVVFETEAYVYVLYVLLLCLKDKKTCL